MSEQTGPINFQSFEQVEEYMAWLSRNHIPGTNSDEALEIATNIVAGGVDLLGKQSQDREEEAPQQ